MKKLTYILLIVLLAGFAAPKDYFIYKLKFDTHIEGEQLLETLIENENIESIVRIGRIVDYFDSVKMENVYVDGWHVDIMTTDTIKELRTYIVDTDNPVHSWLGSDHNTKQVRYVYVKPY